MRFWDLSRYALSASVAAALLTGCGGSQPPIGAPGAMLKNHARVCDALPGPSC
jgi:hypothetical protein